MAANCAQGEAYGSTIKYKVDYHLLDYKRVVISWSVMLSKPCLMWVFRQPHGVFSVTWIQAISVP